MKDDLRTEVLHRAQVIRMKEPCLHSHISIRFGGQYLAAVCIFRRTPMHLREQFVLCLETLAYLIIWISFFLMITLLTRTTILLAQKNDKNYAHFYYFTLFMYLASTICDFFQTSVGAFLSSANHEVSLLLTVLPCSEVYVVVKLMIHYSTKTKDFFPPTDRDRSAFLEEFEDIIQAQLPKLRTSMNFFYRTLIALEFILKGVQISDFAGNWFDRLFVNVLEYNTVYRLLDWFLPFQKLKSRFQFLL